MYYTKFTRTKTSQTIYLPVFIIPKTFSLSSYLIWAFALIITSSIEYCWKESTVFSEAIKIVNLETAALSKSYLLTGWS